MKRAGLVLMAVSPLGMGFALSISICPAAFFFGHACPGCGLTRATIALLQADFARALELNPIAPIACPIITGALAWGALTYIRYGRMHIPRWVGWPVVMTAVALNIIWAARILGAFGGLPPV